MPMYRLTPPGQPGELLEADTARSEGIHTVLRGVVLVMGKPREIVLRRVPADVLVEEVTRAERFQTVRLVVGTGDASEEPCPGIDHHRRARQLRRG
ncbi:MAG: hypothetical protein KY440_03465 [Actinobacteria bacterium]|nr:hypothetical protein [Actinomycetota bacterium]